MYNPWIRIGELGLVINIVILLSCNCPVSFAQTVANPIVPDETLPNKSQVRPPEKDKIIITGGTQVNRNLFHSFEKFDVPSGMIAEFNYPNNIDNIMTRVTGNNISQIDGMIKANGTANLFLINPNGIVFGPNASLDIGGSFVASTASNIKFKEGTFSATSPQNDNLLIVSVPLGLQFGATAAPILNQSQTKEGGRPVGLHVPLNKTLALVGGDITLEGGILTTSGRIELGSVTSNSLVSLQPTNQGWTLGYEEVQNFQNIQMIPAVKNPHNFSLVIVDSQSNGDIQVRGKTVTLSGKAMLYTDGNGLDITITSEKLIVKDGSQISIFSGKGNDEGDLTVNASKSVELIGNTTETVVTGLITNTVDGKSTGGNITINTAKLRILDGAGLTSQSTKTEKSPQGLVGGNAGTITVNASESVEIIGQPVKLSENETIYQPSLLSTSTTNYTNAGIVNITTGELIVRDGAKIDANIETTTPINFSDQKTPGQINITARSISLENDAKLLAQSNSSRGGNIALEVQDLLLMRGNSKISATAGTTKRGGDGGNVNINAPHGFIVSPLLENNDITANAYSGSGGNITINANNIFGFVQRTRTDLENFFNNQTIADIKPELLQTNDITAFSEQNALLNGTIQINSLNVDPSKGLVELPLAVINAADQITADCNPSSKLASGSFIVTGRGGMASTPRESLMSNDVVSVDWLKLPPEAQKNQFPQQQSKTTDSLKKANSINNPTQIVEAQGWVTDANGNIVLVAQAPDVTPYTPSLLPPSCLQNISANLNKITKANE